jgi:hemopexin
MNAATRYAPFAACCISTGRTESSRQGQEILFFRRTQYIAWDVEGDAMRDGYPRDIRRDWPGLLEAFAGSTLTGALHVREWGPKIYFQFAGKARCATWDLNARALLEHRPLLSELLPGEISEPPGLVTVYAHTRDGHSVVYGFRGTQYARWSVSDGSGHASLDTGYPRGIRDGWPDGLTVAPDSGVFADWVTRSDAHPNRKIYFFLGDVYLRWDVTTHTRNYRLDVPGGWKGWPRFD